MKKYIDVHGSIEMIGSLENITYIDFDIDTVYIRTDIRQSQDSDLMIYNELQMTYEEYEKYKGTLLIENIETLKREIININKEINNTLTLETSSLDEVKQYYIDKSKINLESYLTNNPIESTCHKGILKCYSITKDKQTLLAQMIAITQLAINNNVEYQPSWNASGEECTYDWTLEELNLLAFEIENVVRPLISKQQGIEAQIKQSETKDEVLNINVNF